MSQPENEQLGSVIWAQSGIAKRKDGVEPFVQLMKDDRVVGQFTVELAREFAGNLLAAAEAAESDAIFTLFSTNELGMDLETASKILVAFRKYRGASGKPSNATSRNEFVVTDQHVKPDETEEIG